MLYAFHVGLVILTCFAELKDRGYFTRPTGGYATRVRGEVSWRMLNLGFGIVTVNVLQIISSADDSVKFKVLMGAFDLVVMIRLFFFNGWFRNEVIGLIGRAQRMEEGQRGVTRPASDVSAGRGNA